MSTPVKDTHWAKRDAETLAEFTATLPAVHNSNLTLWQHRVDRKAETPFMPHVSLFSIEAMEYAKRADGVSAPTDKSFSFLVVAEDRNGAIGKVRAQLAAHGFDANTFAMFTRNRLLILA